MTDSVPWIWAVLVVLTMAAGIHFAERTRSAPGGATTAAAARATSQRKPPVLLMFHAGGFAFGTSDLLAAARQRAAALGFEAHSIDYPLGDVRAAVAAARDEADRYRDEGRRVYAYGESAGGTLAALLAIDGRVEAAATYAQVSNLARFARTVDDPRAYRAAVKADSRILARFSPCHYTPKRDVLALAPADDELSKATLRWDAHEPSVRGRTVPGGHLVDPTDPEVYPRNQDLAMRWLKRRAVPEQGGS